MFLCHEIDSFFFGLIGFGIYEGASLTPFLEQLYKVIVFAAHLRWGGGGGGLCMEQIYPDM